MLDIVEKQVAEVTADQLQKQQKSRKHEQSNLSSKKHSYMSVKSPAGNFDMGNVQNVKQFGSTVKKQAKLVESSDNSHSDEQSDLNFPFLIWQP